MKQKHAVSCILTAYNEERFILEAVESILGQTYKDFELIVVDDGSTDKTPDILAGIKDSRLKVLSQENTGAVYATNRAFKESSGDIVFIMDGDDIAMPERFEVQLEEYERLGEPDILGTGYQSISSAGKGLGTYSAPADHDGIMKAILTLGNYLCNPTVLLKRKSVERHGVYDTYFESSYDVDLFLRMSFDCRFANLQRPLVKYRKHDRSATGKKRFAGLREGTIWMTVVALQRYHLAKEGYGEFWEDEFAKNTLFDMIEERIEGSLFVRQMIMTREWQVAKANLRTPGKIFDGILQATGIFKYPDALVTRIIRKISGGGVITPPNYVTAEELKEEIKARQAG